MGDKEMKKNPILSVLRNQRGVAALVVGGFILFVGIGIMAFVVDFGYRHVAQNQLQNAADAGALAGARALYYEDGTKVNNDGGDPTGQWTLSANQIAYNAATANKSAGTSVEVYNYLSNTGAVNEDVQRGHWSFGLTPIDGSPALQRGFYPNAATDPTPIAGVDETILDADKNFINALKVITRRQASPVKTFFAQIFGQQSFTLRAEAVGYIGFAGKLLPLEADQPIVICQESLAGDYCSIGRMINSGSNNATHNTGGWTNFSQEPCTNTSAGGPDGVQQYICANGNPKALLFGVDMGTTGGMQQSSFDDLISCWQNATYDDDDDPNTPEVPIDTDGDGIPDKVWNLTLPVVTCPSNNLGTCEKLVGAVNVDIVWITGGGDDPHYNDAPEKMEDWDRSSESDGSVRWNDPTNGFVAHFNLKNVDDLFAEYAKKSIYFLPNCTIHEPEGGTGGENYGISAKIPVIVNIPLQDDLNRS